MAGRGHRDGRDTERRQLLDRVGKGEALIQLPQHVWRYQDNFATGEVFEGRWGGSKARRPGHLVMELIGSGHDARARGQGFVEHILHGDHAVPLQVAIAQMLPWTDMRLVGIPLRPLHMEQLVGDVRSEGVANHIIGGKRVERLAERCGQPRNAEAVELVVVVLHEMLVESMVAEKSR